VFDSTTTTWSYRAIVPNILRSTQLPLPGNRIACRELPKRSSLYWTGAMAGQDFSGADRAHAPPFNRALWRGLKADAPYPTVASGADLRTNRQRLLATDQLRTDGCAGP